MIKVKDGYAKLIGATYKGDASHVLLSNGGNLQYSTAKDSNKLVLRTASGYIYATYLNTTISDEALADIGSIYVRNTSDTFIRRISKALFYSIINNKYVTLDTALTITGKKTFAGGIAITAGDQDTAMRYFLGIDPFAEGGTVKWINASNVANAINVYTKTLSDDKYPTKTGGGASGTWNININGYADYLCTHYTSGQKVDPQAYFGKTIGVKVAMTGLKSLGTSYWCDTLWINGYKGDDVKDMCALHFNRDGTPRMFISTLQSTATSYGTLYEILSTYNYKSILNDHYVNVDGDTMTGALIINSEGVKRRMRGDTSNYEPGLTFISKADGNTLATIGYHNTVHRLYLNPNGSENVYSDAVGKYSLCIGVNSLTYNTYPILHEGNYTTIITSVKNPYALTLKVDDSTQVTYDGSVAKTFNINLKLFYNSTTIRNANTVLAAPNGSNGTATFRKLVEADIPELSYSKITNTPDPCISYNFTNGTLVKINANATTNSMITVRIIGNSYSNDSPFDTTVQFYNYNDGNSILEPSAINNGSFFGNIKAFNYNGKICIWFKLIRGFLTFLIRAYSQYNNILSCTAFNSAMPTSGITRLVEIVPKEFSTVTGGSGKNVYSTSTPITTLSGNPTIVRERAYNGVICNYGFSLCGDDSYRSSVRLENVFTEAGTWTVSFEVCGSLSTAVGFDLKVGDTLPIDKVSRIKTTSNNTWTKVTKSFVISSNFNLDFLNIAWAFIYIRYFKVEKGAATSFSPGELDMFHHVGEWTTTDYTYYWLGRYISLRDKATNPLLKFTLGSTNWFVQAYSSNQLHLGTSSNPVIIDTNGNITAHSFIKKGGTAEQVLLANGSVKNLSELGGGSIDAYTKEESESRYVNVDGDTMKGKLNINTSGGGNQFRINNTAGGETYFYLASAGTNKGALTVARPSYGTAIYNAVSTKYLGITDAGVPHFQGNELLHKGNYTSILDARYYTESESDAKYVTLATSLSITGIKTFTTQQKFTVAKGTAPFTVTSDTMVTNLNAEKLGGVKYLNILERLGSGTSDLKNSNWYRIAETKSIDAMGASFILLLHRSYNNTNNESYTFSINIAYNGGISITQLSGHANTKLISQIRVDWKSSSIAYIDFYILTTYTNTYSWTTIGSAKSYSTATVASVVGTTYNFTTTNGFKSGSITMNNSIYLDSTAAIDRGLIITGAKKTGFIYGSSEKRGIYDYTNGRWAFAIETSGNTTLNGGNVGIGIAPSYKLDVNGTIHASDKISSPNGFWKESDRRLKSDIKPLTHTLDLICSIPTTSFIMNNTRQIGTIALDLEAIGLNELVSEDNSEEYVKIKKVEYEMLSIIAIEGIKLLKDEVDKLKKYYHE